jgi:hypothetical protein
MQRALRVWTALVASAAAVAAFAPSALADSANVTLTAPTEAFDTGEVITRTGASVATKFTLGSVDSGIGYSVTVTSQASGVETPVCSYDGSTIVVGAELACTFDANFPGGTYDVELVHVHESNTWLDYLFTMYVRPNAESATATPLVFYPLVRDGYRDTTRFSFAFDTVADVTVQVKNKSGRVIRRVPVGDRQSGSWRWNGRNRAGNKVDPGYYWIRAVSAIATFGIHDAVGKTSWIRVRVKTALVRRQATKRRAGDNFSSRATSGNCYVFVSHYFNTANPDCFGGNYALVRYGFRVPGSAYNISWAVRGGRGGDDLCCYGSINKIGTRMSSRRYVVTVMVTGYRSYEVERVRASYSYKKRI